MALDTLDFWIGTFALYVLATIEVILFAWVLGIDRGFEELNRGAEIRIPNFFKFIIKYVSPLYLLTIFVLWSYNELFGPDATRLKEIQSSRVVQMSIGFIAIVAILFTLLIAQSVRRWNAADREKQAEEVTP